MNKIIVLIMAVLSFSFVAKGKTVSRIVSEIEDGILSDNAYMPFTKKIIDQGMNRAIEIAVYHLNKKKEYALADELYYGWKLTYNRTLFGSERDIGDHSGIFQWVNDIYRRIEFVLGREFCVNTHIAAMLTFNSANVIIRPCTFPMDSVQGDRIDEYRRHFAGKSVVSDSNYNGVIPESVYFVVQIGCLAGTAGIGSVICSLAASAGGRLVATFVAPRLSDRIFNRACNKIEIGDY